MIILNFIENHIGLITFLTFCALIWYAWETRRLVKETRRNFEELKKQNDFLKEIDKQKYALERKSICKSLLYEIGENEVSLFSLSVFFESKPDKVEKFLERFKEGIPEKFFKNNIYNKFIEENIGFKNNKIFDNVDTLYLNIKSIEIYLELILSADKNLTVPEVLISETIDAIKNSLNIINNLYDLFSEEIDYSYRESEAYKRSQIMINFLKNKNLRKIENL